MTCYRVTFKDINGLETTMPVISTSAVQAVVDLGTLGYQIRKVTHCFPAV